VPLIALLWILKPLPARRLIALRSMVARPRVGDSTTSPLTWGGKKELLLRGGGMAAWTRPFCRRRATGPGKCFMVNVVSNSELEVFFW